MKNNINYKNVPKMDIDKLSVLLKAEYNYNLHKIRKNGTVIIYTGKRFFGFKKKIRVKMEELLLNLLPRMTSRYVFNSEDGVDLYKRNIGRLLSQEKRSNREKNIIENIQESIDYLCKQAFRSSIVRNNLGSKDEMFITPSNQIEGDSDCEIIQEINYQGSKNNTNVIIINRETYPDILELAAGLFYRARRIVAASTLVVALSTLRPISCSINEGVSVIPLMNLHQVIRNCNYDTS